METLCYEVWKDDKMIHAYWDVQMAWKVMVGINQVSKEGDEALVIVANGMQYNVETKKTSRRTDVVGADGRGGRLPDHYDWPDNND